MRGGRSGAVSFSWSSDRGGIMMRCLLVKGVIVEGRLECKLGTRVVMSFCFW